MRLNLKSPIKAVLFDLDGTLLDTAPDLLKALNRLCLEYQRPPVSLEKLIAVANLGSKKMVKMALEVDELDSSFHQLRQKFLSFYEEHIADQTALFPDMEKVLSHLEEQRIPWGIVTNKLLKQTYTLLKKLNLKHQPACVICGDSLAKAKPDPLPILHACEILQQHPNDCLYVGDAITDVVAGKAAGTQTLVALYGYIDNIDNPLTWNADAYIKKPTDFLQFLKK